MQVGVKIHIGKRFETPAIDLNLLNAEKILSLDCSNGFTLLKVC
ncbi:hypothetical protein [Agrobacterium vitis]|nr:hypothetical protein [Agrobacterium vitis]